MANRGPLKIFEVWRDPEKYSWLKLFASGPPNKCLWTVPFIAANDSNKVVLFPNLPPPQKSLKKMGQLSPFQSLNPPPPNTLKHQ